MLVRSFLVRWAACTWGFTNALPRSCHPSDLDRWTTAYKELLELQILLARRNRDLNERLAASSHVNLTDGGVLRSAIDQTRRDLKVEWRKLRTVKGFDEHEQFVIDYLDFLTAFLDLQQHRLCSGGG